MMEDRVSVIYFLVVNSGVIFCFVKLCIMGERIRIGIVSISEI